MDLHEKVERAAAFIQEKTDKAQPAAIGLILGSGLDGVARAMTVETVLSYSDIPGFPPATVSGHAGELALGTLAGTAVLACRGRFHLYEGHPAPETCIHIRVLGALGVRTLITTCAAGALNPEFHTGDLMLIADHINATGHTPLTGPNVEEWGTRFPDMSRAYSSRLLDAATEGGRELALPLRRGVYVQVAGPQLETPAETRMYRTLGADAIGMSAALETICARHMGLDVLGVACLTNANDPDDMAPITHEGVVQQAGAGADGLAGLLKATIERITP